MDIIRLCGIAATAAAAAVILKSYKSEYSVFVGSIASIIIFAASFGFIYPVLAYISEIAENTAFENYISCRWR